MKALRLLVLTGWLVVPASVVAQDAEKPNILVIWGDDIGFWNISHNNRGMMAYQTPNIDRIADEGVAFTDYYGQQSCTAGRAAFVGGTVPVRTGMTKVGLPGAQEGWQESDITIAAVMKSLGYATGQFGKNHFGDRDEHLPTNHGFDEFFGNLYHLNAEEEPEHRDYPGDYVLPSGETFREKWGPRGVIKASANDDGTQTIENTGPLTKKRMETVDEETLEAAKDFIKRQHEAGKPFFTWWNATRMHFRTHVKEEHMGISGASGNEYHDGMVEHDRHVGELLDQLDELGIADNTIVFYSTDNGPHYNTWPDAGTTPFRSEKNSNWEGAYRVPAFVRWPEKFPAGTTINGLVAHEDWMPTFASIGGKDNLKEELLDGYDAIGREYKNHLDGYDLSEYLSKAGSFETINDDIAASPRKEFWYFNDDGQVVAIRLGDWKGVFYENRGEAFEVWREPFTELRVPLLFNLRRDPFEKAQHNSNTYNDWFLDHSFVLVPMQAAAARFSQTFIDYPPSQKPGSFNLEGIVEKLKETSGAR
ncbi:arylsulfatase [Marinobacter sp. F4206]|uniref:arylsulfatase n=1 Tax=Marinobacter sp. F4206 TaxID=2861777 RepID=UPI001C5E4369|nr:arylsulfatase [Marinobacter sp. F4206]MBW4933149.1 arylsulfatase [Marinobacter sp. F4206]